MVELGVMMKAPYSESFGNPEILLESGAKLGNFRKLVPKMLMHPVLEQATDMWISALNK